MSFDPVSAAFEVGGKLIDRLWPDPAQRDAAKLELAKMQESGELAVMANETEQLRIAVTDRDSARKREAAVGDKTTRNLAYLVVGAFVGVVIATLAGWSKVDSVLAGALIGYLSAKAEQVIAYYFGSSAGSRGKDETIKAMAK